MLRTVCEALLPGLRDARCVLRRKHRRTPAFHARGPDPVRAYKKIEKWRDPVVLEDFSSLR